MKSLLITSVKVILPGNEFHQQQVDVFIEKGKIAQIGKSVKVADKNIETLDGAGKVLAPGFFDLHANFGEPGLETKEDIVSGSAAAAAGGFTGIAVMPNTERRFKAVPRLHLLSIQRKEILLMYIQLERSVKREKGKNWPSYLI